MRYGSAVLTCAGVLLAAGAALADGRTITVSEKTCARLVKHEPAADVAYEGGVDVRGNEVAPAELGGGHDLDLPDTIEIPIEVELFETGTPSGGADEEGADEEAADADSAVPVEDAGFSGDARVGTVAVDLETGRATFNGKPITSRAQRELAARCRERFGDGMP